MSYRCRACKGTGLAGDGTCDRCDAYGEVEELTPEEQAADREALLEQNRRLRAVFSDMLMDAGVRPAQRKRGKR